MNTAKIDLERTIGKGRVAVVDSSMKLISITKWTEAVTMILSNRAYMLTGDSKNTLIRSQSISIERPLIICLYKYVSQEYKAKLSRRNILLRDNFTCVYCGKYGNTIDHIFPKSKGGTNDWSNLCCACSSCNATKSNRILTEEELSIIKIPSITDMINNVIIESLDNEMVKQSQFVG